MVRQRLRVLLIDDSFADARVIEAHLAHSQPEGFELRRAQQLEDALALLEEETFDCVFLDYLLEHISGLEVLQAIRDTNNDVPVIMVTGCGSEQVAVDALRLGAEDYLVKGDLTPHGVQRALTNAIERVSLARRLAEQQEELKSFASVAAHDLQAPVRRILGFSEVLLEDLTDIDEDSRRHLETIAISAKRLQELIKRLLEYTRVGRAQQQLRCVKLDDVVRRAVDNLESTLQECDAQVEFDSLPAVQGDVVGLVQLLQNLIGNAVKFRSDRVPLVRIEAKPAGDAWTVSVIDNGIGIEPQYQGMVFAPFRRLHTQSEYEGTGLGLAICKRIVDQHEGRIWLESEAGQGTTIRFTLPAAEAEVGESEAAAAPRSSESQSA